MPEPTTYESPLAARNASPEMLRLFSPKHKFGLWRRLWLELARCQRELGISRVSAEALGQMERALDDINFDRAAHHEKRLRHDVMAHVHTFEEAAPAAKGIIHLGATSQYVVDNADLIVMRDAMRMQAQRLANAIDALATFAVKWKDLPTLGYTHFQPAQLTTVGKRATLWAQDLAIDLKELEHRIATLRFRGVKGTTGTQASFLTLFDGDHAKVDRLDRMVTERFGFRESFPSPARPTRARSTRRSSPASPASPPACTSSATTSGSSRPQAGRGAVRGRAGRLQRDGVQAQPHALRARDRPGPLRHQPQHQPAANRGRAVVRAHAGRLQQQAPRHPRAVPSHRRLPPDRRERRPRARRVPQDDPRRRAGRTPFMATEEILMEAVQAGGDRQALHEVIREHSQLAGEGVKQHGRPNDLLDRLQSHPAFAKIDLGSLMDPARFIGRAPQQVDAFVRDVVTPVRERYRAVLGQTVELKV
jgi:adenylosuccinate lyase